LTATPVADHAKIYAGLKSQVSAAGILDRSVVYYLPTLSSAFGGFFASLYAVYALDAFAPLALACLAFAFFSVQVAGLMHDAGHRCVFNSKRGNDLLGYASCFLTGAVFESWRWHHNTHHAYPNQVDKDPDMEIPFIAASAELYRSKTGIQRFAARWQVYYYHSLGLFVSISNRLGMSTFFFKKRTRHLPLKVALYLPAIIVFFPLPFFIFPLAKALFVFAIVHATSGVYLANVFAPNHKGMRQIAADEKLSFLEQQVITARNVSGGWLLNYVMLGLNYQTEHHLFPTTPRKKLRLLTPYVRRACAEAGITYTDVGIIATNRVLLKSLGDATRKRSVSVPATP
jgi:fatty acid desaturase